MKRTFLIIALFLFAFTATAQEQKVSLEKKGDLVEATYYHDNGQVAQTGTFKNEKLHGVWKKYDQDGNKIAVGTYDNGKKVGKWFFWSGTSLKEVDYTDNAVANVSEWKSKEVIVSRNK